jgi:hypothetical protein
MAMTFLKEATIGWIYNVIVIVYKKNKSKSNIRPTHRINTKSTQFTSILKPQKALRLQIIPKDHHQNRKIITPHCQLQNQCP